MKQGIIYHCQNTLGLIVSTALDEPSTARHTPGPACGRGGSSLWEQSLRCQLCTCVHSHVHSRNIWGLPLLVTAPVLANHRSHLCLPPAAHLVGVQWGLCILAFKRSSARCETTPVVRLDLFDEGRCTRKGYPPLQVLEPVLFLPSAWIPRPF